MKLRYVSIIVLCLALTGCQKTPDQSAVVSKADGLSQEVIAEPLKEGEKNMLDVPENWKFCELRSDDCLL